MSENINAVIVQRGYLRFGHTKTKADGTEETEPCKWTPSPNGTGVIVCPFDTDTNEQIGEADIFPIWDSIGLDKNIRKKLALTKRNFPTPEEWYRWLKEWDDRNIDICKICHGYFGGYDCEECPIEAIKSITEGEDNEDE